MAKSSLCSIDGCGKGGKLRRGMCARHYGRWARLGDPLAGGPYAPRGEPMRFLLEHMHDDCPKWPFARGRGGYGRVQHDGEVRDVHRLVCEMAHGAPPTPSHDAAHSCGKGHEGCFGAGCLAWKTKTENQGDRLAHGTAMRGTSLPQTKLSEDDVRSIRAAKGLWTQGEIAAEYGIDRVTVCNIHRGKSWSWLK